MMQPVYIRSASAISAQDTFGATQLPEVLHHSDNGILFVQDPDYRDFINPVAIRRMSRLLKRGISTGIKALQLAGIEKPDGIITGTGLGSMTDMERFVKDMINFDEEALNPTYFIQSTYNSINGWLALQTKCTGYNQTYVHRGHSLELSLLDAQMLLNETNEEKHYLVGGFDEMTEEHFYIKGKKNYWKKGINNTLDLLNQSDTPGTIAGEGAAFFTLSNKKEEAACVLKGIKVLPGIDAARVSQSITELLDAHHISAHDIDIMYCGMNGDSRHQPLYDHITKTASPNTSIAAFKHISGEYETATGFALWLATQTFGTQTLHPATIIKQGDSDTVKNILIVNHYLEGNASVLLLSIV